jgi:hypothetical protein
MRGRRLIHELRVYPRLDGWGTEEPHRTTWSTSPPSAQTSEWSRYLPLFISVLVALSGEGRDAGSLLAPRGKSYK